MARNQVWAELPERLRSNPLFHYSENTGFVPRLDKIRPHHFRPALRYAFKLGARQVQALHDDPNPPNFKNTYEALDSCYELAEYLMGVLALTIPRSEKEQDKYYDLIESLDLQYEQLLDKLYQDKTIYARCQAAKHDLGSGKSLRERKSLIQVYEDAFIFTGVHLPPDKQKEYLHDSKITSKLETRMSRRMTYAAERCAVVTKNPERLKGVSKFVLATAAELASETGHAPGSYAFNLSGEYYEPFMRYAEDRALRRKLHTAYHAQAAAGRYDNREIAMQLLHLYHKSARMLGYESPAHQYLSDQMVQKPEEVEALLLEMRDKALPKLAREMQAISDFAKNPPSGIAAVDELQPWDADYYEERLKRYIFGFDDEDLRPYFELETTLQGLFLHFDKFFGISFREKPNYRSYDKDVRAFEVYRTGSGFALGTALFDLPARRFKPAGIAWQCDFLGQGLFEGKVRRPVSIIVTKMADSEKGEPVLLRHSDVVILMHELGHLVNTMLSQCRYSCHSGVNSEIGWCEYPSQFMENYCYEPEFLDTVAFHYQTGEPMPGEMKGALREYRRFGGARREMMYLSRSWVDLFAMRNDPAQFASIEALEEAAARSLDLPSFGEPGGVALQLPRFHYGFGSGYESRYSFYSVARILSHDTFQIFRRDGLYNPRLKTLFKQALEKGGSETGAALFHSLVGRDPDKRPYYYHEGVCDTPVANTDAPAPSDLLVLREEASASDYGRMAANLG